MTLSKTVSKVLMAGCLLTALPISASAEETKAPIDYVALGDSLAAGITPFGQDGPGYPEYLTARFEKSHFPIKLDNLGVSGYTSSHLVLKILNDPTTQQKIKDSELVTIDIGANDLLAALQANPSLAGAAITNVKTNLQKILTTIKQLNPKTEVYVMGYYNPFPYQPLEQQAALLPLLDSLNGVIQLTAVTNGYTYVQTAKVIAKNYETYLTNPLNIHLSTDGYQVIAKEFWKAIDN